MDSEAWSLFTQLPVVGIFVLFTLYSNKLTTAERTTRYQAEVNERALRDTAQHARDTEFLDGLRELRKQHTEDMKDVAACLSRLQAELSRIAGILSDSSRQG